MVTQFRYVNKVKQNDDGEKWKNLDNIKLDDWQVLASCKLGPKEKPASFNCFDFNFNIPLESKIEEIFVEHNFKRDSSSYPIKVKPPIIKLMINGKTLEKKSYYEAGVYPVERGVAFTPNDMDFDVEEINNTISCVVEFPENTTDNEGILYFDFLRIRIVYEATHYALTAGQTSSDFPTENKPIDKAVGDTFKFTLYFNNLNGVSSKKQDVDVVFDKSAFKVEKCYFKNMANSINSEVTDNEFDKENNIWNPGVRGQGKSFIRLVVKCLKEGTYTFHAFNKEAGLTPQLFVKVHPEDNKFPKRQFEEEMGKWDAELEEEGIVLADEETVIRVEDVSMEFDMPQEKIDNLKEYCIKWIKRELKPKNHFKALNNISFEINAGERVGIIGFNGAGKSTLLKVLAGVYKPTTGSVEIKGKIAPLLELGAGFDHNYSGRENVFLNGAILGYSKEFLESKYDEIVEFSELGDFMEIPIKNYSSGMNAKLGFSVATVVNPEILILDEILSVGDVKFQKKSSDKLKSMMGSGTTVLLVSHSIGQIREICNRAIWIDKGKLVMDGEVNEVCNAYIDAAKEASADELKDQKLV